MFSCSQDDIVIEKEDPSETEQEEVDHFFDLSFSSFGSFNSSVSFIVLSDINGETLYDTLGSDLDIDINFQLDSSIAVNATIGFVKEDEFSIVSYSRIKSGSQLDLSRDWETHPCFDSGPVDGRRAKLYITDVNEFHETINSIAWFPFNSTELKGDTLILEGTPPNQWSNSFQVAIREEENSELMSIVIPKQDWTWDNDSQSMSHTVSFTDFTSTNEHVINLERTDRWDFTAKACDQDGNVVALQSSNYSTLEVDEISLYLNQAIDVNEIKFHLTNNEYTRNWIQQSIPNEINIEFTQNPAFSVLEVNEFVILNTYNYNVNVLNYLYNGYYNWTIISKGGINISFVKPKLPSQLLETFDYLDDVLQNSFGIINTMYRTENPIDDITKIHKSVIPRNKNSDPDFNYSSKETRLDL
jgi:hypothetical protein